MRLTVTCTDLNTEERVQGVRLNCTVKVVPRVTVATPPREPGEPDPTPPKIIVRHDQAEELPSKERISDGDGRAVFEFGLARPYARLAEANAGDRFVDVQAFVRMRARVDGLDRETPFVLVTSSAESATGEVEIERPAIIDLAKTIVGHTTDTSVRLWFQLHAEQLANHRYECVVEPASGARPPQTLVIEAFDEDTDAQTKTLEVGGLSPGQPYRYRLWLRRPAPSTAHRVLCEGAFRTASQDERALTVMFGSCFKPIDNSEIYAPALDFEHWRRLAERDDGDVQLFLGDQIYADEIPDPEAGDTWKDAFIRRYNAFWAYGPVRRALARRPTYMITDDHEIADDWGVFGIAEGRLIAGIEAFKTFQLAHTPSGRNGPFHYHFRRGPVAFFMMDGRSARGTDREYPIFGPDQWRSFLDWAKSSEVETADVIVFATPVPVALLPINELRKIARRGATVIGSLLGAGLMGVPGFFHGAIGAQPIYDRLEETLIGDMDYREMWNLEANQRELQRLLNVLFNLANDLGFEDPDAPPGPRPRAVFILGGDCHFGLTHMIVSNREGGPDHRLNPTMMHLTSSAIGRPPQDSEELRALFEDVDGKTPDFDSLRTRLVSLVSEKAAEFILDDRREKNYRTCALGVVFERNLGRLHIEQLGDARRYRVETRIEGEQRNVEHTFEVDLEARPVTWRPFARDLDVTPDVVSFGSVPEGKVVTRRITIENRTGRDVRATVAASTARPFSWQPWSGVLRHAQSQRIELSFRSPGPGITRGVLTITSDTPGRRHSVSLLGKSAGGFPTPDPDSPTNLPLNLTVSPKALGFGSLTPGTVATRTVTIENQTGRTIRLTISPPPRGPFSWAPFDGTIAYGTKRKVEVRFTATANLHRATMTIRSDTPASPQTVGMTGKGPGGFPTPQPGF